MFRRNFLRASAFFGVGMLASDVVLPAATTPPEGTKPALPPVSAPTAMPAASAAGMAAAYPPEFGPASARGKVAEVYQAARQVMYPICRVCPQCDGVACCGEFPGMGGLWSGASFQNNFKDLQQVRLKLRPLNAVSDQDHKPDTSTVLFGQKLSLPAVAAPIGGTGSNFRHLLADPEYFDRIIGGCVDAGTLGAIGDGQTDPMDQVRARYQVIKRYQGRAVAGIKPRPQANLLQLVRLAEEAGACAITIDIDSGGRYQGNPRDVAVEPKSKAQIREIVGATRIPVVVKGIMTPEDAVWALEAGAAGICVSNHGGRVLDHTPGTAAVLPAIAAAVKGRLVILVDGCVHYGDDVLKYVALGADAVMVGRHIIRAAFGGGRPGVALFMQTMRQELEAAMVVTGMPDVRSIDRRILA